MKIQKSNEIIKNEVDMDELKNSLLDSINKMVFANRKKTYIIKKINEMQSLEDYISIAKEIRLYFRRYKFFTYCPMDLWSIMSFKDEVETYLVFEKGYDIDIYTYTYHPHIDIEMYYANKHGDIYQKNYVFPVRENINYTEETLVLRNFESLVYCIPYGKSNL